MAKVSAMEEDGAATGGAAVAALPAQSTGDVDADALVKGVIDGGAGAPERNVFTFSGENVQGVLEATQAGGAAGAAVASVPAQSVWDMDADAMAEGGTDGGAGAPAGVVFAFSAEQVQGALEATGAALATMTDVLLDELNRKAIKLFNGFLPEFAGALATELAAHVQVAVHKL
jgi:hypothetical protein